MPNRQQPSFKFRKIFFFLRVQSFRLGCVRSNPRDVLFCISSYLPGCGTALSSLPSPLLFFFPGSVFHNMIMHCLPGTSYVLTCGPHLSRRNYCRSHERANEKMQKKNNNNNKLKIPPVERREELPMCQNSPNAFASNERCQHICFRTEPQFRE